jgi:hypothetical protein
MDLRPMNSRFIAAACLTTLVCVSFSCSRQVTQRPQGVKIAACPTTNLYANRFTVDFVLSFYAPQKAFTVKIVQRDMPPEVVFMVTPDGHAGAKLTVSRDSEDFRDLEVAYPTFSSYVEERDVQDFKGRSFGTDRWGYLQSGERWRYVKFITGGKVGYDPLPTKQADLLDQVVNSACRLSPQ